MTSAADITLGAAAAGVSALISDLDPSTVTPRLAIKLNREAATVIENRAIADMLIGRRDAVLEMLVQDAADKPESWRDRFYDAFNAGLSDIPRRIAEAAPPSEDRDKLLGLAEASLRRDWRGVGPLLEYFLHSSHLTDTDRADATAVLGLVKLQLGDAANAHALIERALTVAPQSWYPVFAQGVLIANGSEAEKDMLAEAAYLRADMLAGGDASLPINAIGQRRLDNGSLAEAEQLFNRATKCATFPSEGYIALINLAGHRQLYPDRRARIPELIEMACLFAFGLGEQIDAMVAAAEAAAGNGDFDEAENWFVKASELDPLRIDVHLQHGGRSRESGRFDTALACLMRARSLDPNSPEVAWAFALLAEAQRNWPQMLDEAMQAVEHRPEWLDTVTTILEEAAGTIYEASPRMTAEMAEMILDRLRAANGQSYEARYHNLLGNLRFWQSRYVEAARCYNEATTINAEEPQYFANFALAAEKSLAEVGYAPAMAAIDKAVAQRGDPEDHALRQRLVQAGTVIERYGPAAGRLRPATDRIRVYVPTSHMWQIADSGEEKLSAQTQTHIAELRQSIKGAFGFTLCGINFRDTTEEVSAGRGGLTIDMGGVRVLERSPIDEDLDVLGVVAETVRDNPALAFGHDEAQFCADACAKGDEFRQNPARLNGLTCTIRDWLSRHPEMTDEELAELVTNAPELKPGTAQSSALGMESISLSALPEPAEQAQEEIYNRSGVLIPLSAAAIFDKSYLDLNNLAGLLDQSGLYFAMQTLREAAPQLVMVAERLLGDNLVPALRSRVAAGQSIRNLLPTLEQLLLPIPDWTAPAFVRTSLLTSS